MQIKVIPCLNDNYSYLIFEKETNTVSIIDPAEYIPCEQELAKYGKLNVTSSVCLQCALQLCGRCRDSKTL